MGNYWTKMPFNIKGHLSNTCYSAEKFVWINYSKKKQKKKNKKKTLWYEYLPNEGFNASSCKNKRIKKWWKQ